MLNGQLTDPAKTWLQLQVQVPREQAAEVEAALHFIGALSVSFTDSADHPVLEPGVGETPLWPDVLMTGLFEDTHQADELLAALRRRAPGLPGLDARVSELRDQDWTRAWLDDFKPMQFGQRLWVVPGNQAIPPGAQRVVQLDPGLAFGSGTHPTTQMCLEWLDSQALEGRSVLDYGCGSGILAIAAAVLGADRVMAVDNDPQALVSSRNNAANNAVSEKLEVLSPDVLPERHHDFVVANILAGALIDLAPGLADMCKPSGRIALSGIMQAQASEVQAAYEPYFGNFEVQRREEWVLIGAARNTEEQV